MFFKLTIHLACDPIILLLGIYKREIKTYVHTNACIWSFMALVKFIMAKDWKQRKQPTTSEYINNSWHIHIMKYYAATKRKNVLIQTTTWKNLKCFMPRESSQTQFITYECDSMLCEILENGKQYWWWEKGSLTKENEGHLGDAG